MTDPIEIAPLPQDALALQTERLLLRPLTRDDLDLSTALFTDPKVVRYVCDTLTPEEVAQNLHNEVRRAAGGRIGIWTATRKDTVAQIGTCVLLPLPIEHENTDWSLMIEDRYPDAEIEVGYMLLPEAWGQGFATEICRRLLRFGFQHTPLAAIKATTDPENVASQRVLMKCGLKNEGLRRAYATDECTGFGILRDNWERLAK